MQTYAAKVNPFLNWLLHKGNQYFSELKLVARSKKNILPINSQPKAREYEKPAGSTTGARCFAECMLHSVKA
jgi:hypothetical protein